GNGWEDQMNKHLTDDQIAKCGAGQSTGEERRHIQECTACQGKLDRLDNSISLFRSAIRDRIDARVALHAPEILLEERPLVVTTPLWQWTVVIVVSFVLITIPFFITRPQQFIDSASSATDADTLMREINLHLSRTIPAPMEPIMKLIPDNESIRQLGGVQ